MSKKWRCLSLGAGVQSTTMSLMVAHGVIEPPDFAIFADTGWEPRAVYDHLAWLRGDNVLPFPVHIVQRGNLKDDLLQKATGNVDKRFAAVPFFTKKRMPQPPKDPDELVSVRQRGGLLFDDEEVDEDVLMPARHAYEIQLLSWRRREDGIGRRQCTGEYKVEPIAAKQRELMGYGPNVRIPRGSIEVMIGISTDEAVRMKPARYVWQENLYPLIDARMSRDDCYTWLERRGYPVVRPEDADPAAGIQPWPPSSSCLGCPYHDNRKWRLIRDTPGDEWQDTVATDHAIRKGGTLNGMRDQQFMHRSLVPLDEADLSTNEERGQGDLFGNECEGMCGV